MANFTFSSSRQSIIENFFSTLKIQKSTASGPLSPLKDGGVNLKKQYKLEGLSQATTWATLFCCTTNCCCICSNPCTTYSNTPTSSPRATSPCSPPSYSGTFLTVLLGGMILFQIEHSLAARIELINHILTYHKKFSDTKMFQI